jgi:hypothetical protein
MDNIAEGFERNDLEFRQFLSTKDPLEKQGRNYTEY